MTIRSWTKAALAAYFCSGLFVAPALAAPAVPGTKPDASVNLLTNPSFELPAVVTDESSIPGWTLQFRHNTTDPPLSPDEVSIVDDPKQAHSGRRFLRVRADKRNIYLLSPRAASFEPGLYEVSAWVKGHPNTIGPLGLSALNANLGTGVQGLTNQWSKRSVIVYSKGLTSTPFPEMTSLLLGASQGAGTLMDIDDVSITRLTAGLADAFSDHMVLQRGRPVPVWGWAKLPGQKVTVSFNGQTVTGAADAEGRWQVMLRPMPAGGPYTLSVDGLAAAFDVMVGDVWICAGQSNMEFGLDLLHGYFNHAPDELAKADQRMIRLWTAAKQFSPTPMRTYRIQQDMYYSDFQANWNVCSPQTASWGAWGGFSAVGYFFGQEIQADQHVAIGLMMIANGGTQIESFMSEESLKAIPREQWIVPPISQAEKDHLKNSPPAQLPPDIAALSRAYAEVIGKYLTFESMKGDVDSKSFNYASAVYNGLVSPVMPYAVRGVLWYQGEHNGGDVHYDAKLKAFIADWRSRLGQKDLPFIIAQLCNWRRPEGENGFAVVRDAQFRVTRSDPKTGLAVTLDLADKEGDGYGPGEIHPKNKLEVGRRMALAARSVAYGEKLVSSGPLYRSMKIDAGKVRLSFDSVGGGLMIKGGATLTGFTVTGTDHTFAPADAVIDGNDVVVSAARVPQPVAVRYAYAGFVPAFNLYNKEGLPASPFRTDNWATP